MSLLYRSLSFAFLVVLASVASAFGQSGFVKSSDQPIPGATITATQGSQTVSTVTDADGHYALGTLAPGVWKVQVEIFGFETLKKDVDFGAAPGPLNLELNLAEPQFARRMGQGAGGPEQRQGFGRGGGFPRAGTGGGTNGPIPRREGTGGPPNADAPSTANNTNANQIPDQELQNELNAQNPAAPTASAGGENGNESFLVSGSLSPGMAPGGQADSGPDMRMGGPDPFGGPGQQLGAGAAGGTEAPGVPGAVSGAAVPAGGGFGGGFGGRGGFGGGPGGFGGRGGQGGPGARGERRPGQVAGATFGNRRRRNQGIHGQASFTLTNSAVNAQPFSINGLDIPQAAYAQSRFSLIFGGPLVIPKLAHDPKTQFFVTYFGTRSRTPRLFTQTVPTASQRNGDFSQSIQSLGTSATSAPVAIFDPSTRFAFPNNAIPVNRLNPAALRLLQFYPAPNQTGLTNNYQYETAQASNSDNLGVRLQRSVTAKDRLALNVQYQRRDGTTAQAFGYSDDTNGYGLSTQLQWTRNLTTKSVLTTQVRFNRNYNEIVPYFSLIPNVAAELNIQGISTNPLNAGPPTLNFTNFGSLSDSNPTLNRNQSQGVSQSLSWSKGLHSLTFGYGYTRSDQSAQTSTNGRGTLNFTGLATSQLGANGQPLTGTGYDLADLLLDAPQSSSIQYSQYSNYFRQNQMNFYAQDQWKLKPNLTLTLGVRYEYFSPFAEKYGREANLDIAPGYSNVSRVTPSVPGPYTGEFPGGLIDPDRNNWSPRLALAWKLPFKRSTLFRAGYGIYYNGQVYTQFTNMLAQQPPFAVSSSINTSATRPLTILNAFTSLSANDIANTFAVDRYYRTPYAGTWNASLQRDFAGGFFLEIGYLGTKGTRLDIRTTPNQGSTLTLAQRNQLGNAVGFTFDQSDGNSIFHAGHIRLVRRFNRGISLNAFYQYAKSIDDSSTFGGAGNTVAQNWLDLSAERGLSSFDVRHQLSANFVWTSPVAGPGNHMAADSFTGRLLKDWQINGGITAQTGNPLTARVLGNSQKLAQTGGTGSGRAEATGEPIDLGTGLFNLDAFTVPVTGTFGNAARNTIPGPGLFNLNLSFGRSFGFSERRRVEFRVESNNVLNHVNYTSYYTVVNSVNYALPSAAGSMRTLDAVVRFRF
ncbi:MAG: TonB-dependent receptor [Bryobacteraceae bacterium]